MPKYLVQASYTAEGIKGLTADKPSGRKAAVARAIESLGGKLECFYFAFGESDVIGVMDVPDNGVAARFALQIAGSGQLRGKTTPLLTAEELDKALTQTADYRAPGEKR